MTTRDPASAPRSHAAPAVSSPSIVLLLNAMSEAERRELAARLEDAADAIAIRKNPLVEDLDPHDAEGALRASFRALAPALSSGAGLALGAWSSETGDIDVRVVERCEVTAARCLDPFAPAKTAPLELRARFLAWPIASSIVLAVEPPSATGAVVRALRDGDRASSSIALALDDGDLHALRATASLDAVRRGAKRLLDEAPSDFPERALVEQLAHAATIDAVAWLRLPPGAVLVVPRLSAVADAEPFAGEVRARTHAVDGARVERLAPRTSD